jgi:putative ABC transport system substrate-binding protein
MRRSIGCDLALGRGHALKMALDKVPIAREIAPNTIPIVIAVSADPVRAGLVQSVGRPGGNTTGLSLLAPETDEKNLELLKETLPKTRRVAMIIDPKNQGMMLRLNAIKTAAEFLLSHDLSLLGTWLA